MPDLPDHDARTASAPVDIKAKAVVRWADLRLRVLSALVLAPIALACVWFGGFAWVALVALMAVGLSLEWAQLCGRPWSDAGTLVLTGVVLVAGGLGFAGEVTAALGALVAGLAGVWAIGGRASLAAGVLYVGLTALALAWLRADPVAGRANLLFVVLVVWASDIVAYAVGRLVGGPRLAPSISPGKTWSGAVGGLAGALAIGVAAASQSGTLSGGIMAAALLGIVSQAGDLLESAIKRRFGVKDSGRLIPGHGGLLDRLDGLLAAAPVAALLVAVLGRGGVMWR